MPFALNTAAVPRNLDVEDTLMRWTKRFDYVVTRRRSSRGLQTFLEHRFVIRFRSTQRIRTGEFVSQRITDKTRGCFESTVEKDRTRDRFKHIGEQGILLATATLLFPTSESQKVAEV